MADVSKMYIDLMKKVLTDYHRMELGEYKHINTDEKTWKTNALLAIDKVVGTRGYSVMKRVEFERQQREEGRDWPAYADTMIGMKRLDNLEFCIREVVKNDIPGDVIETGVWRGGSTIFMKAVLRALGQDVRKVWVADSFEGLPKPNAEKYDADKFDEHYKIQELAISVDTVKYNFQKYDLLDDNVMFLKGWFKDTLPRNQINRARY